jgi:succinoglycan biosynthesis transport protein ExoP
MTVADYLAILRRRKWVIVQAVVIVPVVALILSIRQPALYGASAQVLLSRQNLGAELSGIQDPTLAQDPIRLSQTQADLARAPGVAQHAVTAAGVRGETAGALLANSSVSPASNADLLIFTVRDANPDVAQRLATAYASAFTKYGQEINTAHLEIARTELLSRIADLRRSGDTKSSLYSALVQREQQLRELEILQPTNTLLSPALAAEKLQPRPKHNALLGLIFGILIGVGLAFLWETLDQRVRSEDEIENELGLPLLGRLPEPPRTGRAIMLREPTSPYAEPFRRLRTSYEFANLGNRAQTVLVTSAVQQEGKSTTAANLAVALARLGQHVVLVDLDLRQSALADLFGVSSNPGVTDVAVQHVTLDETLTDVFIGGNTGPRISSNGSTAWKPTGKLEILPAGSVVPDPGEFVGTAALTKILDTLRPRADTVLIDAPPMLGVVDALALAPQVDALLVVTRLRVIRRKSLKELARVLDTIPSRKLGFVITGTELDERDAYRYPYGHSREPTPASETMLTP